MKKPTDEDYEFAILYINELQQQFRDEQEFQARIAEDERQRYLDDGGNPDLLGDWGK
jgi:hypothetical protein